VKRNHERHETARKEERDFWLLMVDGTFFGGGWDGWRLARKEELVLLKTGPTAIGIGTRTPGHITMNILRLAVASVFLMLTVTARSADGPRGEELAALDRYVGVWDDTSDPGGKVTATCEWILEGSFLRHSWTFDSGDGAPKNVGMQLMSYDAAARTFRAWTFYANGIAGQGEGVWDAASKTFTWTLRDPANGQTTVTKITFVGDDQEDCSSITTDRDGKLVSQVTRKKVRRK
jgi:hypothetical protein